MTDLVIGLDVGTSATKALAVSDDGTIVASATRPYSTHRTTDGYVEQHPERWWSAVVACVGEITTTVDPGRVRAIGLSCQGGTLVCTDGAGRPVLPARSWLDNRPTASAQRLAERFGAHDFYDRTGWRLGPRYNAAQIGHLSADEPHLFDATALFLDTASFLTLRLTGSAINDFNSAGITQLTRAEAAAYDSDILDAIGVDQTRLPQLVPSGTDVGSLTAAAAAELGLPASVRVVAGGHDQYCAAVGAGATDARTLLLSAGTAWVVLGSASTPLKDPHEDYSFSNHVMPGLWGQFGSLLNGGSSLEWMRAVWSEGGQPLALDTLEAEAAATAAGAEGLLFLPHFGATTPDWNEDSRGSFVGADLVHERRHFVRATLEGIAAEAAALISLHRELNPAPETIRLIGGATRNRTWTRIIADMVDMPVDVSGVTDAAGIGAAIVAAAGEPGRIAETADRMVGDASRVDPSEDRDIYREQGNVRRHFASVLSSAYTTTTTRQGRN